MPQFIQVELDAPLAVRSITVTPGTGMANVGGEIQVSDDGQNFRGIKPFNMGRATTRPYTVATDEPVYSRFFRIVFNRAGERTSQLTLAEIDLSGRQMIENLQNKAGFQPGEVFTQTDQTSTEQAIVREKILDLTDKLASDGRLTWDVPKGEWTIMRMATRPPASTITAPPEATGLECDKFSTEALDAHWAGWMQKILDEVGPLAGSTLNNCLIDSYETGNQNWTPKMKEEFQKRRGYDMTRYLPVLTGRVVDNPEVSERFLWDLRRTIADLFADNYYALHGALPRAGLISSFEPYTGPFESLQSGRTADVVMGEFWSGSQGDPSVKLAGSIADIYGKQIVGTESFTAASGTWAMAGRSVLAQGTGRFNVLPPA